MDLFKYFKPAKNLNNTICGNLIVFHGIISDDDTAGTSILYRHIQYKCCVHMYCCITSKLLLQMFSMNGHLLSKPETSHSKSFATCSTIVVKLFILLEYINKFQCMPPSLTVGIEPTN